MRRPTRTRRLSIAAVLSLLAFVAVAGIGVRSFWVFDLWSHDVWHMVYLRGGRIEIYSQGSDRTTMKELMADPEFRGHRTGYMTDYPWWTLREFFSQFTDFWKFRIHHYAEYQPGNWYIKPEHVWGWNIFIPLWFPLVLLLIAPLLWIIARSANTAAFPVLAGAEKK